MSKRLAYAVAIIGVLALPVVADEDDKGPTVAQHAAIAEALQPSLVRVEFTLQMDRGQPPRVSGWQRRCSRVRMLRPRRSGARLTGSWCRRHRATPPW